MEAILIKVFATALALSLVTTRPDAIKTEFDPVHDQQEVMEILSDGCAHMRKAFGIESVDLDDLIETAMLDPSAESDEMLGFRGIKFADLHLAYRQICNREALPNPVVNAAELIEFFNETVADVPDAGALKDLQLPGLTAISDAKGRRYAELFEPEHRRVSVRLSAVPLHVRNAFIAAEDQRFYEHRGVDERSVIRAFLVMFADPKSRQGGSTITQQVAKNLLVGDEISYERKIREIISAARVERMLSKDDILEIYLNAIFLGRGTWGIEMAARAYFGKNASELTLGEGALLAGLTKGPNFYNPDRHPTRVRERLAYVLDRMRQDKMISTEDMERALANPPTLIPHERERRSSGFHFVDHLTREARQRAKIPSLTLSSYNVRSTVVPDVQRAAERALQEGLARYEQSTGRVRFERAERNISDAIKRIEADPKRSNPDEPAWLSALKAANMPLYDVQWDTAVVLEKTRLKSGQDSIRVGLSDGRVLPISTWGSKTRQILEINDVVYVRIVDQKKAVRVELRSRPQVQGSAVVLDNRTGRILAMAGSFSYPLSQLNRTTQTRRQPGSALKPLTFLAALNAGLQPNTIIQDTPITFPPIGSTRYASARDWWSPQNYDRSYAGATTLRRALEQSRNLPTAHLLDGGISHSPETSLDQICQIALAAQVYQECERYYPFILGAQPVRLIDLAAFYATIANEGRRPTPHSIDTIEHDGKTIYRSRPALEAIPSVDAASTVQLKSILQGVLARGTAGGYSHLSRYVAGKTGTSDQENDAWFVGFSNEVTIAVWVGYDNDRGRRTLGSGRTGSNVALPIFNDIMQAVWSSHAPRTVLRGPSPEAARQLVSMPIDVRSGQIIRGAGQGTFAEYFRRGPDGRVVDTQYRLTSHGQYYYRQEEQQSAAPWDARRPFDWPPRPFESPFFGPPRYESWQYRSAPPPGYVAPGQTRYYQERYQQPPPSPDEQRRRSEEYIGRQHRIY